MWGVLAPAIVLWVFGSPGGLQTPIFGSVSGDLTLPSKWGCDSELEDTKVKYCSWYELKRKVDTHEHVKQCRMWKVVCITEDQTCCAYEVVILANNVVWLKSLNNYKNHMQKFIAKVFRKIAMFVFDKMKQLDFSVQQVIIENCLIHPLMENIRLDHLINLQGLKAHEEVMSNLKFGITNHLIGQQKA